MPTFVDESGGTGPVLTPSDRFFHLAAVWVPTLDDAARFSQECASVRSQLGVGPGHEFKFSKTHRLPEHRRSFYRAALSIPFRFAVASVDKRASDWRERGDLKRPPTAEEIHLVALVELAAHLRPLYLARHVGPSALPKRPPPDPIRVDRNDDKKFLSRVTGVFRPLGSACDPHRKLIDGARFGDSDKDDMLQLADMVCGATAAARVEGDGRWWEMIRERDVG